MLQGNSIYSFNVLASGLFLLPLMFSFFTDFFSILCFNFDDFFFLRVVSLSGALL